MILFQLRDKESMGGAEGLAILDFVRQVNHFAL